VIVSFHWGGEDRQPNDGQRLLGRAAMRRADLVLGRHHT
jgi:hypothetical protein